MTMPRRGFLGALAVAPAAVAACSTGAAVKKPALPARGGADGAGGAPPTESRGVVKVRAFSLAPDVEPAFTFRASVARAGER